MPRSPDEQDRLNEKLEILDGSRSTRSKRRAAVRYEDLQPLLQIPQRLQSGPAAGAAPTAAEYDKLVTEVDFLRARLFEVQTIMQAAFLERPVR